MTIPIVHASAARVRAALTGRHNLTDEQISGICGTLVDAGLASADLGGADRIHAAQVSHVNALENEARKTAQRIGLAISASGKIEPDALARALNGYSIEARLRMKSMFGAAGMIA